LFRLACCMRATPENLEVLSKLNFYGIEIPASVQLNPYIISKEEREKIRSMVESFDLKIVAANVIYPREMRHVAEDENVRQKSIEYTWKLAEAAADIDCRILVWGSSFARNIPPDMPFDVGRERNLAILKEAEKAGQEYGVIFAIEPLSKRESNFINTVIEAYEVAESIGANYLMVLADLRHMIREEESVLDSLRKVSKRLVHVHIADENSRVPGKGVLDFTKILKVLEEIGYKGCLSIESRIEGNVMEELAFAKRYLESSYAKIFAP